VTATSRDLVRTFPVVTIAANPYFKPSITLLSRSTHRSFFWGSRGPALAGMEIVWLWRSKGHWHRLCFWEQGWLNVLTHFKLDLAMYPRYLSHCDGRWFACFHTNLTQSLQVTSSLVCCGWMRWNSWEVRILSPIVTHCFYLSQKRTRKATRDIGAYVCVWGQYLRVAS
jgi:hypothetical protein